MRLKDFRIDYKLSQSDLANVFGCKQSNVSLIEKGERTLTGLHLRLLIEQYGIDTIAPYCEPDELPKQTISIDLSKSEIKGNTAPVQQGVGNTMSLEDAKLIDVLEKQAAVISQQSDQINKLIAQQEKLINALVSTK